MYKRINKILNENNSLVIKAKKSRKLPNLLWLLILSIILLFSSEIIAGMLSSPIGILLHSNKTLTPYKNLLLLLSQLVGCIFLILLIFFRVSVFEKRKISSIGLDKNNAIKKYLRGFIIGILMMSSVVILLSLFGCLSIDKSSQQPTGVSAFLPVLIILVGWIIQGSSEEIFTRGWLMNILGAKYNIKLGLLVSSLFFSALHLLNPNVNIISILNIALVGFFFGLYIIRSGDLWGACAIHSAWNFAQGNIFGFEVSGINVEIGTLIDFNLIGNDIITGGAFGPEAGLCATFVLLISILVLIYIPEKKFKL